jgi:hypothetical protein
MFNAGYPYRPPRVRGHKLKPVKLEDEGTEGKVSRFGWMTDGAVRPIEQGLPLHPYPTNRPHPQASLLRLLVDKPYVKEFNHHYAYLAERHPEYDLSDPDMMSHYEKQLIAQYSPDTSAARAGELNIRVPGTNQKTSRIPLDAHLHTWGGAIPYLETEIFPEDEMDVVDHRPKRQKPRTGIAGEPNRRATDLSSIIRPIKFRTLSDTEAHDPSLSRDDASSPLIFAPAGKRYAASITSLPGGNCDDTCQTCLRRFFDPEVGIPFVPADVGKYFPLELLLPTEPPTESEGDESLIGNSGDDCDPRSTLLDTSNEDVLFTKDKAPFTRADISTVRAFERHWDNLKLKQRQRAAESLEARRRLVHQAFHSKEVFKTYLQLVDEDCQRIRSGVIGKSPYKTKSLWKVAVERAPNDRSGLADRRTYWWRFATFVRYIGGISEPLETEIVKSLRVKLMLRHPIGPKLFWDLVGDLPIVAFESVSALRLIEFIRVSLNAGQQEFVLFLDDRKVSRMIYNQAIVSNMSKEFQDKLNLIGRGPIDVPYID